MKKWYYLHPEYKENLANRVSDMKVIYFDEVIHGINGSELIRQGLTKDVSFKDGELLAQMELLPLIVNEKWRDAANCLTVTKETKSTDQLRMLSIHEQDKSTEFEIPSLNEIALLCVKLKDKARAERLLTDFTTNSTEGWCNCAKLWHFLFDNSEKAIKCLKKAEKSTKNCSHWDTCSAWIECAEAWKNILNDNDRTQKCFETTENIAKHTPGWLDCAEGWKSIFNDDRETNICLNNAYEEVENSLELGLMIASCAESWAKLFNDKNRAEDYLKEAETYLDLSFDWISCAWHWKNLFNFPLQAKTCLKTATKHETSSLFLTWVAEAWKKMFNDIIEIRKCLEKAEKVVESSFDWSICAEKWMELTNDVARARECLEKAEKRAEKDAKCFEDFGLIADYWNELFNDTVRAKKCLKKAKLLSMSSELKQKQRDYKGKNDKEQINN